jgi:hypothetical protein
MPAGSSLFMRWRFVLGLLIALNATWYPKGAAAAADAGATLADQAADAFWWGDFEELERLYALARSSSQRTAAGATQIQEFRAGVSRPLRGNTADSDAYYVQVLALTRQWTQRRPASPLAHLLYARALYGQAWFVRGGAYAGSVPPQAMAEFEKGIRAAVEHLTTHWNEVRSDPTAHVYLIMVGRSAGWSANQLWAIARDGLDKNAEDVGIYEELMFSLLPEWGGTYQQVDQVVQEALARTSKTRGLELYAALYQHFAIHLSARLFKESLADWVRMKQGFRELLAKYPDPAIVNRFAMAACLAQDKDTLNELLDRIADKPLLREWGRGSSQPYDTCRRWARGG